MKPLELIASLLLLSGCVIHQTMPSTEGVRTRIKACGAYNIRHCGDLICEGDRDPESIIWGTTSAILACIDDPTMSNEYLSRSAQMRVLKSYKLKWWWSDD